MFEPTSRDAYLHVQKIVEIAQRKNVDLMYGRTCTIAHCHDWLQETTNNTWIAIQDTDSSPKMLNLQPEFEMLELNVRDSNYIYPVHKLRY